MHDYPIQLQDVPNQPGKGCGVSEQLSNNECRTRKSLSDEFSRAPSSALQGEMDRCPSAQKSKRRTCSNGVLPWPRLPCVETSKPPGSAGAFWSVSGTDMLLTCCYPLKHVASGSQGTQGAEKFREWWHATRDATRSRRLLGPKWNR